MIRAAAVALAANGLIYLGLAFVNGRVAPGLAAPFYAATGTLFRLALMTLLFAAPANGLLARVFRMLPPAQATATILGSLVVVLVVNAFMLSGHVPWRAALAGAICAAAAAWFGVELAA